VILSAAVASAEATAAELKPLPHLGQLLFFDKNLSEPAGQSCASCHSARVGYTGGVEAINAGGAVYPGAAMGGWFGNRRPPSAAYAGGSPDLEHDAGAFTGGMFVDGRASGWTLGDPLAEQAGGPFLNTWEQNNATKAVVVDKVRKGSYAKLFLQVWGA
jgi:cytochrome c peroxidase